MTDFGARSIGLPMLTPTTLLAAEKAEAIAKRGLSFAELSRVDPGHLERLLAGEMQWAMMRMFQQYDAIAEVLLPTALIPNQKSPPTTLSPASEPKPELNFGD